VYLAEVGRPFAAALFRFIGGEVIKVADVAKEVDRAGQSSPSRERFRNVKGRSKSTFSRNTKIPNRSLLRKRASYWD
jgi:hypothetical protein